MAEEYIFAERRESLRDLWLFIIVDTTILAILVNILALNVGITGVAPYLLFCPIVIASYWYSEKGLAIAVILSALYLGIVYVFTSGSVGDLFAASVICFILISVAAIISGLASNLRRNEIKYRGLFEYSEAAIGLVRFSSLSILEANQSFLNLLGYKQDDLSGITFGDLFRDPACRDIFFKTLDATGSVRSLRTQFRTKENREPWVLISAGKLPGDYFVCTLIDITETKRAEEAVLIRDHAIRSSINAIAFFDLDFTITSVNNSLIRMMEYSDEKELTGKTASRFMASAPAFEEIRHAVQEKGSWIGETILQKSDKTPFYAFLWAQIVTDETKAPVCIMTSFIDITENKRLEMAKRRALEQIEKNIEQFAILGDHIRNPLAVIVGLSSISDDELSKKIIFQAREIDRIVTQLDKGWLESENVRECIKRYYKVYDGETGGMGAGTTGKSPEIP